MKSRFRFADRSACRVMCAAVYLAVISGCTHPPKIADNTPAPPSVAVAPAQIGMLTPRRELAGTIAPLQNILLSNALNEPAQSVPVVEGDHVSTGTVLAVFDTSDLQANLQNAEANILVAQSNTVRQRASGEQAVRQGTSNAGSAAATLAQAQQKLRLDQLTLKRNEDLLRESFVPQQTVDTARTTVENDLAAVRSAQANLEAARAVVSTNGNYTASNAQPNSDDGIQAATLRAQIAQAAAAKAQAAQLRVQIARGIMHSPVDGIVVNRNLNPGEYPNGRTLFILQETGRVYAVLGASAAQLAGIRTGTTASVVTSGRNGTLRGTVTAVLGQTNPGASNFTVKILLADPNGNLLSGLPVRATVTLQPVRGVRIPRGAFIDATHSQIIEVRDQKAYRRTVTSIAEEGPWAIVSGINSGARIVTDGNASLSDGQTVHVR